LRLVPEWPLAGGFLSDEGIASLGLDGYASTIARNDMGRQVHEDAGGRKEIGHREVPANAKMIIEQMSKGSKTR
jgi:hypothetical protein